jgi:putative membrane protein
VTAQTAPAEPAEASAGDTVPWKHLDIRVVWVNATVFLLSLGSGLLGLYLFPSGDVWPLLVACGFGVLTTALDLQRWLTTRYRITEQRVEKRTGWLFLEYRGVPRERIRGIDTSARIRHRIAQLRVVHIEAGEAGLKSTFSLNALRKEMAAQLRRELIPDQHPELGEQETVIARFRWYWIFYTMFQFWAFFAAAMFLHASYWFLRSFDIDLIETVENAAVSAGLGTGLSVLVGVAAVFVLGFFGLAFEFVAKFWNFELVRTVEKSGALLTRHGLFTTQSVYREDRRIRGIHIYEPLLLRWMQLAETTLVTTGIHAMRKETANILPRCPAGEARRVAKHVLPGDVEPLEAPLLQHPRSALRQRLMRATYVPAAVAGIMLWLGATGVWADWIWQIPLLFLPFTWVLGVIAYYSLGHTLVGDYLVVRSGVTGRATVALQTRAVAGWKLQQTIFQRVARRMTVGIPTAAGHRYYRAPDAGLDQALAFINGATPWLAAEFIEKASPPPSPEKPDHPTEGEIGGKNAAH